MDLYQWASKTEAGPRFYGWGIFTSTRKEIVAIQSLLRDGMSKPDWVTNPTFYKECRMFYSIFEKWDGDLGNYISGDYYNTLKSIDRDVMIAFANHIVALHDLGVCHLDLLPKNILVKEENGKIVKLAMTDFGIFILRTNWFFARENKDRAIFINYYINSRVTDRIYDALCDRYSDLIPIGKRETLSMWLEHEPFHFDWIIYITWCILNNQEEPIESLLKKPRFVRFDVPWDNVGVLQVFLFVNNTVGRKINVQAFESLTELREELAKTDEKFLNYHYLTMDDKLMKIEHDKEKDYTISDVLAELSLNWIIQFC
jgi:serine/threonine protein kinase